MVVVLERINILINASFKNFFLGVLIKVPTDFIEKVLVLKKPIIKSEKKI